MYWLSLFTKKDMSGHVWVKYCSPRIPILNTIRYFNFSSSVVNCLPVIIGVWHGEVFPSWISSAGDLYIWIARGTFQLNLFALLCPKNNVINQNILERRHHWVVLFKDWRNLLLLHLTIMSFTYIRKKLIWSLLFRWKREKSLFVFWNP